MKKIICFILSIILCFSVSTVSFAVNEKKLKFNENGEFKILVLSDTQDDAQPSKDMLNLIKTAISNTNPDLIVFTGDLVEDSRFADMGTDSRNFFEGVNVSNLDGSINHEKTLVQLTKAADNVLSVFQSSGVPFVIAMGDNDYKCSVTADEWLEIFSKYSNCLTVDTGVTDDNRIDDNHLIYGNDGEVKFNIWTFDTGRSCFEASQIEWYKTTQSRIVENNGGKTVPSFVFQHKYTCDVGNLFEECSIFDNGATLLDGKFYRLNTDIASGYNDIAYMPGEVSDEFKAWKECGDVIGAYFGHQHFEGFTGTVDGIELGFNYGCEMAKPGPYGYRVITLYENDILKYDNEMFIYSGSVKDGDVRITKQDESVQMNFAERIIYKAKIYITKFLQMMSILDKFN